jgi:thioredoxin:protein disulfide reductase
MKFSENVQMKKCFSPLLQYFVILQVSILIFQNNASASNHRVSPSHQQLGNQCYSASFQFDWTDSQDFLLKDSIRITSDDPHTEIQSFTADQDAESLYLQEYHTQMMVYKTGVIVTAKVTTGTQPQVRLSLSYMFSNQKEAHYKEFVIPTGDNLSPETAATIPHQVEQSQAQDESQADSWLEHMTRKIASFKETIFDFVKTSNSLTIQLCASFLLGLLMSLTPCIYPMIPITIGVLQTNVQKSVFKNFLLASCYALGMAGTFAFLGLLAATGSAPFGVLLGNVGFVLLLALFLIYLAFSMFGWYELYIPNFLQPKNHTVNGGSYVSAFVFGALSGTFASPCLSPGLLLLLTIVATLGNKVLGFLMLLIFGLGLSTPLLIIGTFSNSLLFLPRAGMWMVEVKKIFGILLLSLALFYLTNVMPLWFVWILSGFMSLLVAIAYTPKTSKGSFHNSATILIFTIGAGLSWYLAVKHFFATADTLSTSSHYSEVWVHNYEVGKIKAHQENKLILLDFGAEWCSSCKALEKHLFVADVMNALEDQIQFIKVDCTHPTDEPCASIQKKYGVFGFPTIVLADPETETIRKKWGGELLDATPEEFVAEIGAVSSR